MRQESFAGGGQTTAAIETAIAAGGPATVEAAATASPEGPLAQLREELDSFNVDEDSALRLLAQLTDAELYLVGRDATMLENMASAFDGGEMTRALNLLRFMPLKNALKFISDAGEAEDVPAATYQT